MASHPRAVLFTFDDLGDTTYPPGHPFRPERARMLIEILKNEGLLDQPFHRVVAAREASRAELEAFHAPEYLDALEAAGQGEMGLRQLEVGLGGEDCPAFRGLHLIAARAAGASLEGARMLVDGECDVAFNPVGGFHHAGAGHAEGFCYVNDVVLACQRFAAAGRRVACVDLDVHHGNGTEDAFLRDPRVLTISTHETGATLYPWRGFEHETGSGEGEGYAINVPLPPGTDDDLFARAFRGVVLPALEDFAPEALVVEIGMDVLAGDPLAHLKMTNNAIADAVAELGRLALPTLVVGGGGYHPANAARGWALAWSVLCNAEPEDEYAGALGGVFLGSVERRGGLRDMRSFASGEERERLKDEIDRVISWHREHAARWRDNP